MDAPNEPVASGDVRREQYGRLVWRAGLLALLVVVGLGWTVASPVGSSPDDDFHLASIWCSSTAPAGACVDVADGDGGGKRDVEVPSAVAAAPMHCFAQAGSQSADCVASVVAGEGARSPSRANDGLYPDGYYDVLGVFVTENAARSVLVMRMVTWILCVGALGAGLGATPSRWRPRFAMAMLATSVPLTIFLFASTNPSGPTIAGTVACACAMVGAIEAQNRRALVISVVVAVLAAVMALTARSDGGVWLTVAAILVAVVEHDRLRAARVRALVPVAVVALSAAFFATTGASGVTSGLQIGTEPRPLSDVLFRNITDLPSLWFGSFGTWGLGWLDTPMPAICWVGMIGAVAAVLFAGARHMFAAKRAALVLGLVAITVFPLVVLAGDGNVVGEAVQPRYLLPILPVILAVSLWRSTSASGPTFTRSQSVLLGTVVVLAHAAALHTNLRRYVWGLDRDGFNLDDGREWWWAGGPSPMTVWVVSSVAFGLVTASVLGSVLRWEGRQAPGSSVLTPLEEGTIDRRDDDARMSCSPGDRTARHATTVEPSARLGVHVGPDRPASDHPG